MSNPAPAQFSVRPGPAGFWQVLDPAGTHIISTLNPAAAITAANQLTAGVPFDQVRAELEAAPPAAPAAPVTNEDGYSAESLAGFVGDPNAANAAAAEQPTSGARITTMPIETSAAMDGGSTEPLVIPYPDLIAALAASPSPATASPVLPGHYRFLNPAEVPALASMIIAEMAMAAQSSGNPDEQVAMMIQVVPRFLRKFMLAEDFLRFERDADRHLKGLTGTISLCNWATDAASRYTGFPTRPAVS